MKYIIFSFTDKGSQLNQKLNQYFRDVGKQSAGYTTGRFASQWNLKPLPENVSEWIGSQWGDAAFLFIGAAGIAIRYIAPWVEDKFTDSPVIVLDENGRYVIPLLSGHVGGAVGLAERISDWLGAAPVVTTATDVQGRFAVDVFAKKNGFELGDRQLAKEISAAVLEGKEIGIYSELPLNEELPEGVVLCENADALCVYEYGIVITADKKIRFMRKDAGEEHCDKKNLDASQPKPEIVVGIGCRRGTPKEVLQAGLQEVLSSLALPQAQMEAIVSIDLKKDEKGLLALAQECGVVLRTFSAEELNTVETVSSRSEFVKQTTGVDNVCERAVRFYCPEGEVILPKCTVNGATFAVALKHRMKRILLFAGTTEGRKLAEQLRELPVCVYVSTATEYGKECIAMQKENAGLANNRQTVLTGRMDQNQMIEFIKEKKIDLVIDATHPFATEVTKSLKLACVQCRVEYVRCLREEQKLTQEQKENIIFVESVQEAVEYLKKQKGKIFIATGSKELEVYTQIPGYKERCVVRVLSTKEAVQECETLGFRGRNLIAMQGPFDKELNAAMLRHIGADFFVTKESGKEGGFLEKAEAAKETGVKLIVIRRPVEEGLSLQETWDYVKKYDEQCI